MLFRVLKNIPQDATFDQDRGVSLGKEVLMRTKFAASYDLSAATDRLPISIQMLVINHLVPGLGEP
jgi:hypothetical protein